MGKALELADKMWNSDAEVKDLNPWAAFQGLDEVKKDVAFVGAFGNVMAVRTPEGLVLVDTSSQFASHQVIKALREWNKDPVHSVVYTHGHVDHVCGMGLFDKEATEAGRDRPRVYAHERVAERFERYRLTKGYNATINSRQFQVGKSFWPTDYRDPDETFRKEHTLTVGGEAFELYHDRGETDDHCWIYAPERNVVFTGDLFIWASPNCGNPQKVQRFPIEWSRALKKMRDKKADVLLPGHGPPIVGAERVEQALSETAELLSTIHDQTVELMNKGLPLSAVLEQVTYPEKLLERPYLRPIYDEPSFIVRNLWRLYGGWYDGNPAHLKPAPAEQLAVELADSVGGAEALAARATALADKGQLELAAHFVEWAWQAAKGDERMKVAVVRASIYEARSGKETSLMAKNIFKSAVREAKKVIEGR